MQATPYRYVLPIPSFLRGKLLEYNRLYAYPTLPEPPAENGFVVMDSGAFGLSLQKKKMNQAYLESLALHYSQYQQDNYFKVAPDEFKNARQSMLNFKSFFEKNNSICPVLQFSDKKISWKEISYQLDFYIQFGVIKKLFFSNPAMKAIDFLNADLENKLLKIKAGYPVSTIHILGAGWSVKDLQGYSNILGFDSMDSIAYYTSVQQKDYWTNEKKDDTIQQCTEHAKIANEILQ